MKNKALEKKLSDQITDHIQSRKTLMLSSLDENGHPYASYAPFAFDHDSIYVLLSEIAIHGKNLIHHPRASVLIVEDEDSAKELFARIRVSYQVEAENIPSESEQWHEAIEHLATRQGDRIRKLSELADFKLFRLHLKGGRFVKGFGKAYTISGNSLTGTELSHLMEGHRKKQPETEAG